MSKEKFQNMRLFERMAVRLANHIGISEEQYFECLKPALQSYFKHLRYADIVGPLIRYDHSENKMSLQQIATKYHVSVRTVRYALEKGMPNRGTESTE